MTDPNVSDVYNFVVGQDEIIPEGYTLGELRQVVDPEIGWGVYPGAPPGDQESIQQLIDYDVAHGVDHTNDPNPTAVYGYDPITGNVDWHYDYEADKPNTTNSFAFESGHNTINVIGDQPLLWTAFGYNDVQIDPNTNAMTIAGGGAGNWVDNGTADTNLTVNEPGGNDTIRSGVGNTTVATGVGNSQINLSAQASWATDSVTSGGKDTITGGHGKLIASVNGGFISTATDGQDTISLGSAGSLVYSLGTDVINGSTGNDTISV